jgi:hypothetical protein
MSTMMPTCSTAPEAAPKASAAEADLKNFLQKRYDADLAKSAATYETHVMASRGLHEAQQHLMKTKRIMQRLESDLREAKEAAVDATAAVDRKRKAAADAEDDFNADIRLARHCYGIRCAALEKAAVGDAPEPALKCQPVYSPVDPTYRGGETPSVNPYESQGGCETPTFAPTSASYVPQDPNCGCYHVSPTFTPPGSPRPTYKPTSSPPPHSPHTAAAARSRALKWGLSNKT